MSALPKAEIATYLETLVGASSVRRYHGHPMLTSQSVADHSARVSMMAFFIALEHYGNINDAHRVSSLAVFHDLTEAVVQNDCNSVVKSHYGIRDALKLVEQDMVSAAFPSDGEASHIMRDLLLGNNAALDHYLVKMADTLDFGLQLWHEAMLGNTYVIPMFSFFTSEFDKYPDSIKNLTFSVTAKSKILSLVK